MRTTLKFAVSRREDAKAWLEPSELDANTILLRAKGAVKIILSTSIALESVRSPTTAPPAAAAVPLWMIRPVCCSSPRSSSGFTLFNRCFARLVVDVIKINHNTTLEIGFLTNGMFHKTEKRIIH